MLAFTTQLHEDLLLKLEELDKVYDPKSILPDQRLALIMTVMEQIKGKLKDYLFASEGEEVYFFKSVLPATLSLVIYYNEKFDLDSVELVGSPKLRYEYYEKVFNKIDDFFKENMEFFKYYRSGKTQLDNLYFRRASSLNYETSSQLASVMDSSFATVYSVRLATIFAYKRLEDDIYKNLADKKEDLIVANSKKQRTQWTGSIVSLTELIYSLKKQGVFNHGKATLKNITDCFEETFSIRLGNTSKIFQDILCRKKGYTNFLDQLRDNLNKGIEEIEQRHIRH